MPATYWKSDKEKDLTGREVMDQAKATGKPCGMASSTIERHMNAIAALVHPGRAEGNVIDFTPSLNGLIPVDTRSDDEKREVPTFDELHYLFSHPLWQGCKSKGRRHDPGTLVIKDQHYWVNLLLAYSGAGRSEIAGLLETDLSEEDGIPFVQIRSNRLRGLKNTASKRRVPLDPHVMELGFAEFVHVIRQKGKLSLFPEAIPAHLRHLADVADGSEAAYDKKFADVLDHMMRTCLERSLNGNPRGLSCHGMRYYVNDHLSNLRQDDGASHVVAELDRMDIMGHTPSNVNAAPYRRAEKSHGPLHYAIKTLPRLF